MECSVWMKGTDGEIVLHEEALFPEKPLRGRGAVFSKIIPLFKKLGVFS